MADWTEAHIATLRQLNDDGMSCELIARTMSERLGTSFTRNAIIGKIHRMKIQKHVYPTQRLGVGNQYSLVEKKAGVISIPKRRPPRILVKDIPPENISVHPMSLFDAGDKVCHWVVSLEAVYPAMMCGDPVAYRGCSYCGYHRSVGTGTERPQKPYKPFRSVLLSR